MAAKKGVLHAAFVCDDCGKTFEMHKTAQKEAAAHAKKMVHKVRGEVAYLFIYGDKK